MPIYEYTCHGCGEDVELWQKISEKPKKICPSCGARKLERVISHTSFHLKGSGWYVTDYAKKGSSATSSPKKDKPATPKASETSSD
ncbi:MAG: zinc ribbon domain-containing protein [Polyangia bacterium]|jgi:putative FmdB family regulatory protein|nr:zinc ribbon domain-containing protein [Polyangia bacterium]